MDEYKENFLQIFRIDKEEALAYIENYCAQHPDDDDAKLMLALYSQSVFIGDHFSAKIILDDLMVKNVRNSKALLLLCYIEDIYWGQITEETLEYIATTINQSQNDQYKQYFFFMRALYYSRIDKLKYEQFLKESIEADVNSSRNYWLLGIELGNIQLLTQSINNVEHVYTESEIENLNPINFDEFINQSIRGIHMTIVNYESKKETIERMKNRTP